MSSVIDESYIPFFEWLFLTVYYSMLFLSNGIMTFFATHIINKYLYKNNGFFPYKIFWKVFMCNIVAHVVGILIIDCLNIYIDKESFRFLGFRLENFLATFSASIEIKILGLCVIFILELLLVYLTMFKNMQVSNKKKLICLLLNASFTCPYLILLVNIK